MVASRAHAAAQSLELSETEQFFLSSPKDNPFGDKLAAVMRKEPWGCALRKVKKNANVYSSGEYNRNIYLVERGQIKIVAHSKNGKDCLLAIHATGDVFGEQCLLHGTRLETATAMKPTVLREAPSDCFVSVLTQSGLLADFLRYLVVRLEEQRSAITNLVTEDSEQRLAATLLQLAQKIGKRSRGLLEIQERISQEDLGRIVGTTRSRVGYFLKKFSKLGLLDRDAGPFLVIKEDRLRDYLQANS